MIADLMEVVLLQDDLAVFRTSGVGAGAGDRVDVVPLVDQQCLVAVLEPRQVAQPLEVGRY